MNQDAAVRLALMMAMNFDPKQEIKGWMDSIDVAAEIKLIKAKNSKLPRSKRDALLRMDARYNAEKVNQ